jgi:hypothetical protein
MFEIELGSRVVSKITKFEGIVVSRSEHLNGCNRYWVQPQVDKDKKVPDGAWVDEQELDVTSKPKLARKNNDRGGFPSKIR